MSPGGVRQLVGGLGGQRSGSTGRSGCWSWAWHLQEHGGMMDRVSEFDWHGQGEEVIPVVGV
jgi:hypothetical protein